MKSVISWSGCERVYRKSWFNIWFNSMSFLIQKKNAQCPRNRSLKAFWNITRASKVSPRQTEKNECCNVSMIKNKRNQAAHMNLNWLLWQQVYCSRWKLRIIVVIIIPARFPFYCGKRNWFAAVPFHSFLWPTFHIETMHGWALKALYGVSDQMRLIPHVHICN